LTEAGRHNTSPPFSKEEVALIREAVVSPSSRVEYPGCGSPLTIEAVAGDVQRAGWWIQLRKMQA
jgi:hypothetical protein